MAKIFSLLMIVLVMVGFARADTNAFQITDDPSLDSAVAQARASFMAVQTTFGLTYLDAVLLVPNADGTTYRRGTYNGDSTHYPASCVKLAYLAAAMYWCRTNGFTYDYLSTYVDPMITVSDNYDCGYVVDTITGAPNITSINASTDSCTDPVYVAWYDKRLYTMNYLNTHGLVENQIMENKTYPTNSGTDPTGAEELAIDYCIGGNAMQPKCSASLMLEIEKGAIEPGALSYMTTLLTHYNWGDESELGFGLPPGSIYENKPGVAYTDLNDIAYVVLPNGQEFILAAYSDGYSTHAQENPEPYDAAILGVFCEQLIDTLSLDSGDPPKIIVDNTDSGFTTSGTWSSGNAQVDKYGTNYNYAFGSYAPGTATWNLNVPETGLYEVCVWYPEASNRATDSPYTINYNGGSTTFRVNQQVCGGLWFRLGDFNFNAGQGSITLTNTGISDTTKLVVADAVKVTEWPNTVAIDDWDLYDNPNPAGLPEGLRPSELSR